MACSPWASLSRGMTDQQLERSSAAAEPAEASASAPPVPSASRPTRRDANISLITVLTRAADLMPELSIEERLAAFSERDAHDGSGNLVILKCPCRPRVEFMIRDSTALRRHCQSTKHKSGTCSLTLLQCAVQRGDRLFRLLFFLRLPPQA